MQPGDWRLQRIGPDDNLPLIHAVFWLVAVVVVGLILKLGVERVDRGRGR